MLCDLIDWDFCFLGFFLSVTENVSVVGLADWLAGCVCSLAWPIGISDRIFGRGNFLDNRSNRLNRLIFLVDI